MRCRRLLPGILLLVAAATASAAPAPGRELFDRRCQGCHGAQGIGNIGPALRGPKLTIGFVTATVRDGRPGTLMASFGKTLSPAEIDAIARYVASVQPAATPASAGAATAPATVGLHGDPMAGERVFFAARAYACSHCHAFMGRGGHVGPDLTAKARALTPRDLFQRIVVVPHRMPEPRYATLQVTTRVGQVITGIPASETSDSIEFYDTTSLPPLLRELPKKDVVGTRRHPSPVMPRDYASKLTLQELLDTVAFLKSTPVALSSVVN